MRDTIQSAVLLVFVAGRSTMIVWSGMGLVGADHLNHVDVTDAMGSMAYGCHRHRSVIIHRVDADSGNRAGDCSHQQQVHHGVHCGVTQADWLIGH